ncbi:MAG: hypothetical protein KDB14_28390 [Planctomycetales bacterium]|nr:hypothetical protein [Planctomycetales bacterium]
MNIRTADLHRLRQLVEVEAEEGRNPIVIDVFNELVADWVADYLKEHGLQVVVTCIDSTARRLSKNRTYHAIIREHFAGPIIMVRLKCKDLQILRTA